MNRILKYSLCLLFASVHAENHKIMTLFWSYDPVIWSWIEYWRSHGEDKNTNPNTIITSATSNNHKIDCNRNNNSTEDKTLYYHKKHTNPGDTVMLNPLPQDLWGIKLDHSFDELTDNVYWGFSTAYFRSNFTSKQKVETISFFETSILGVGGYVQYQDDEETDYTWFAKLSVLAGPQWLGIKSLDRKFYSTTVMSDKTVYSPCTLGAVGILQLGFKIGLLEITPYILYNWSAETNLTIRKKTTTRGVSNLYFGLAIAPLFK